MAELNGNGLPADQGGDLMPVDPGDQVGPLPSEPGGLTAPKTMQNEKYVIKRTRQPYTGLVMTFAGRLVTAPNGTYEGIFSRELELVSQADSGGQDADKIIRKFQAPRSPRYYRPDGTIVPIGYRLHQHESGIIHTEHADIKGSVVVTTGANGAVGGMAGGANTGNQMTPNKFGIPPTDEDFIVDDNGGGMSGGDTGIIIDDPMLPDDTMNQGGGGY